YLPLGPSTDPIPLLRLKPDANNTAPLHCTIFHTTLSQAPPYKALSYTWGCSSGSREILIVSEVVTVRPNLMHALQRLRPQSREDLGLWIDALCI
ncbi:hypothetical protein B0J14DRAFT_456066, partial [Halenospora varia]